MNRIVSVTVVGSIVSLWAAGCGSSDSDVDLGVADLSASLVDLSRSGDGDAPSTDLAGGSGGQASPLMSFFVSSTGSGAIGGNLGGVTGGDQRCQSLAAAQGFGSKVWHAYLSDNATNARDRIGSGPWFNYAGVQIAASVMTLHMSGVVGANILTELGATVPAAEHAIVTGTKENGTVDDTCSEWTSSAVNRSTTIGFVDWDTTAAAGDRWNNGASSNGCSQAALTTAGSSGRIYCFATN